MNNFKLLNSDHLIHGITTRLGGVSTGPYSSMNTGLFGDDYRDNVLENIRRALTELGTDSKIIILAQQVHSENVVIIDEKTNFESMEKVELENTPLEGFEMYISAVTDGLMTNRKDVLLVTFYADCVPLILYDPVKHVVATVHSGWVGTAKAIGVEAVRKMVSVYGSSESDIRIGIGHSAGICCYEIGDDVIDALKMKFSVDSLRDFVIPKRYGKYMIDLKEANAKLLRDAGILQKHLEIDSDCTICNPEKYHSHRRAKGGKRGMMSAIVQLK
ncbi:MAG: peptidoglycan editing factor PgeF [Clostridia bacterium]|nr:peptidoglycan editing factor PgeF [Clostridia bacterium]